MFILVNLKFDHDYPSVSTITKHQHQYLSTIDQPFIDCEFALNHHEIIQSWSHHPLG